MSALSGLRIVDFSRFLPGAYVSWIAADLGADVIRVEHPRELAKQAAVFAVNDDDAVRTRARPTYFRGKRSVKLNPAHPKAREALLRLVERADVLIEDYRPGVMADMGYGYSELAAVNPRLIYTSVSFAGQNGPLSGQAGHDPGALALAGALSCLNGLPAPTLPGLQVADVLAGAHATIATLAALQSRERSGQGQHVDVAMSDAAMPLLMVNLGRTDDPAGPRLPDGRWHPKGGVWECADGRHLCTTDMEPAYWQRFCEAIGRPDFVALRTIPEEHERMEQDLRALFSTRSRDEWVAHLRAAGTQVMPVLSPTEVLADPHNRARGMALEVPIAGDDPVRQIGLPFRLSADPPVAPRPAGAAGADTDDILRELGFNPADFADAASEDRR